MAAPDVYVRRHRVTCRLSGGEAGGDRAARSALAGGWARRVEEALERAAPEGYWLLRRLDVTASVGAGWSSEEVAEHLARGLVRELARRIRERGTADVLWYPDRAAFLAQYIVDSAAGRTRDRWEYAALGGRSLGELAHEEPEVVLAALVRLRPAELQEVAETFSASEEQVLHALATVPMEPSPARLLATVRALRAAGGLGSSRGRALMLAVSAVRDHRVPLAAVAGPARDVVALLEAQARMPASAYAELLAELAGGGWGSAARHADPDVVLGLVRWGAVDRSELARVLAGADTRRPDRLATAFGGGLVLHRLLDGICDWSACTATWPAVHGTSGLRTARLLTLAAALGRGHDSAAAEDPVLRLLTGCDLSLGELVEYASRLTTEHAETFEGRCAELPAADEHTALAPPFTPSPGAAVLARTARAVLAVLGRSLPGMRAASPTYLWHNVLDFPAWVSLGGEDVVAELGSPPLGVLLSMAGLNRGDLRVGTGEVRWRLTTMS